jgi:hypothetical protein
MNFRRTDQSFTDAGWSGLARADCQSSRKRHDIFRTMTTRRDPHQLGIAQLLHSRHPLIQFGGG